LLIPSSTVATPETGESTIYVVQPGDTLSMIAARYGVTVEALQEANGIEDPDMIIMGHDLIIP
jgi:LysM repeat protein